MLPSSGRLEASWGHFGVVMGRLVRVLVPSWGRFEASWCAFGGISGYPGLILGALSRFLERKCSQIAMKFLLFVVAFLFIVYLNSSTCSQGGGAGALVSERRGAHLHRWGGALTSSTFLIEQEFRARLRRARRFLFIK